MSRWQVATRGKAPRVIPIDDIPECDAGAPMPIVLANDFSVAVAYFGSVRWVSENRPTWDDCIIGVRFEQAMSYTFGMPNEEAAHGHPLAQYGLQPFGFARVENSPWIESLRLINSVHPYHRDDSFASLVHVVLPFHDSMMECAATSYTVTIADGPDVTALDMVAKLIKPEGSAARRFVEGP
jgi:hypothetical protein